MKKIFKLTAENKKPERVLDSIKYDIRRYLKRERKKKLPEDTTFWDFDCVFGKSSTDNNSLNASELITALDKASEESWTECYIEIVAKAVHKEKKVVEKKIETQDEDKEKEEKEEE